MYRRTESLAWLVLLLAFSACIVLGTGIPLTANSYLQNSTRPLVIVLESREGSITYQAANTSTRTVIDQGRPLQVEPRGQVRLAEDGNALLLFYHPDQAETPIGTVQLYGDTSLSIRHARTPRFTMSHEPHRIQLDVAHAVNMRPTVAGNGRAVEFRVFSPHGPIDLDEGSFKLVVEPSQTELKVSLGRATIADPSSGQSFVLVPLQRTSLTSEGLGEIYVGERNILQNRNGNFRDVIGLDSDAEGFWTTYSDHFDETENGGSALQVPLMDGTRIVVFERVGQSHAETGIRQEVNLDLRGVDSLQIRAFIRIGTQTLPVCGSVGTECPIMIRIEFVDRASGAVREWLQGFYTREGTDIPYCQTCEWKAQHIKVPVDTWYDYESENLLPLLRERGIDPGAVREVKIYASGWTYSSAIHEIAILVGE
jgi:hypothetical protein